MPRIYKPMKPRENKAITPAKENEKQEPKMPKSEKDYGKNNNNEQ